MKALYTEGLRFCLSRRVAQSKSVLADKPFEGLGGIIPSQDVRIMAWCEGGRAICYSKEADFSKTAAFRRSEGTTKINVSGSVLRRYTVFMPPLSTKTDLRTA